MQFHIAHLLLFSMVIAGVLALRAWATELGNDGPVAWSIIGSAAIISLGMCSLGSRIRTGIIAGTAFAFLVSVSHAIECTCHSAATDYLRQHPIDAQYSDDTTILTIATIAITFIGAISASLAAWMGSLARGQLKRNAG